MRLTGKAVGALAEMTFGPMTKNPFTMSWADGLHGNNTTVGVVATLTFVVADDATPGNYPITILHDDEDVFNLEWQDIPFADIAGTLTVVAPETEPETETAAEEEDFADNETPEAPEENS